MFAFVRTQRDFVMIALRFNPANLHGRHHLESFGTGPIRCPGARHHVEYADNRATMSVPRSCLRRPPWVRLNFSAVLGSDPSGPIYADDPHSRRAESQRLTPRLPHP